MRSELTKARKIGKSRANVSTRGKRRRFQRRKRENDKLCRVVLYPSVPNRRCFSVWHSRTDVRSITFSSTLPPCVSSDKTNFSANRSNGKSRKKWSPKRKWWTAIVSVWFLPKFRSNHMEGNPWQRIRTEAGYTIAKKRKLSMKSRASCQPYRACTRSDVRTRISRVKQGWRKSSLATEIISPSCSVANINLANVTIRNDSALLRLISTGE